MIPLLEVGQTAIDLYWVQSIWMKKKNKDKPKRKRSYFGCFAINNRLIYIVINNSLSFWIYSSRLKK